jgi:hypothetical protein
MKYNDLQDNLGDETSALDIAAETAGVLSEINSRGFWVPLELKIDEADAVFSEVEVQIGASTGDADADFARAVEELPRLLGEAPFAVRRPGQKDKPAKTKKPAQKKAA